jgi:hypothetical protein
MSSSSTGSPVVASRKPSALSSQTAQFFGSIAVIVSSVRLLPSASLR